MIANLMQHPLRKDSKSVGFNSGSPRFQEKKQVQIITGHDPFTGNLFILKDDKSNLGPGYYLNQNDIEGMRRYYNNLLKHKRLSPRNNLQYGGAGGFSSSTSREDGSLFKTISDQKAYQGYIGQYYNSEQSSVMKNTKNQKY